MLERKDFKSNGLPFISLKQPWIALKVDSYIESQKKKKKINLRSAQLFAANQIRCMVAL